MGRWRCALVLAVALGLSGHRAGAERLLEPPKTVGRLAEANWPKIDIVSGFHALVHKQSRLAIRLIESDGSGSVAEDPVQLFIVVANGRTPDVADTVWQLPYGVARVRKVGATPCGVEIAVDVDDFKAEDDSVIGQVPLTISACFIDPKGQLETELRVTETRPANAPSSRRRSSTSRP